MQTGEGAVRSGGLWQEGRNPEKVRLGAQAENPALSAAYSRDVFSCLPFPSCTPRLCQPTSTWLCP